MQVNKNILSIKEIKNHVLVYQASNKVSQLTWYAPILLDLLDTKP